LELIAWMDTSPLVKMTAHERTKLALFGSILLVADQYTFDSTVVKGWPAGRVGPGDATEGSIKLASSEIEGSRQPFRPPTLLMRHVGLARSACATRFVPGARSHTRPVSRSSTASLFQSVKTTKRVEAGSFWSHEGVA
jgi:hypothetical protein